MIRVMGMTTQTLTFDQRLRLSRILGDFRHLNALRVTWDWATQADAVEIGPLAVLIYEVDRVALALSGELEFLRACAQQIPEETFDGTADVRLSEDAAAKRTKFVDDGGGMVAALLVRLENFDSDMAAWSDSLTATYERLVGGGPPAAAPFITGEQFACAAAAGEAIVAGCLNPLAGVIASADVFILCS
jgi:hypothetical protein